MKNTFCPQCQGHLQWQSKLDPYHSIYTCEACQCDVEKSALCPDCQHNLESIQACGAESYFCPQCNELKSKSRSQIHWQVR